MVLIRIDKRLIRNDHLVNRFNKNRSILTGWDDRPPGDDSKNDKNSLKNIKQGSKIDFTCTKYRSMISIKNFKLPCRSDLVISKTEIFSDTIKIKVSYTDETISQKI